MYKLLIADDEPRIRKGLRNSLDWNELDIEIVGEAEDGEIALEQTKKLSPDLILLDICMPFLNGLELIKKLNEEDQTAIIVIITGHDEFSYMHEALKLKVFDYLLKPVGKDDLKDVVSKAIQELTKLERKKVYIDWASKQVDENFSVLKQGFYKNWINGRLAYQEIINQLDFLKIKLEEDIGMVVIRVIERLNYETYSKNWDRELLNFALNNVATELMTKFNPEITYIDDANNIVIISKTTNISDWLNIGNEIEEKIYSYLHYTVVLGQKRIPNGILGAPDTYKYIISDMDKMSGYKPVVILAIKYINANCSVNDLNLTDVAEKFSVSPSYLSRLLKQESGLTFIDYLTNIRIKKAICLMDDPSLKIYQIAEAVGYNNQHYFCKAFKKIMGHSPTEYRGGY